jgi:hypothetical protein
MKRSICTLVSLIRPNASRLICLALLLCFGLFQTLHAQTAGTEEKPMQHYVMLFRATRTLTPEEQAARPNDLKLWIRHVNDLGIRLEPKNLGALAVTFSSEGNSVVSRETAIDPTLVTMVFFDAPDKEQAIAVARAHPGPHYGVTVELREWEHPQVPLVKQ